MKIVYHIFRGIDKKQLISVVLPDFTKAIDGIKHGLSLANPHYIGYFFSADMRI